MNEYENAARRWSDRGNERVIGRMAVREEIICALKKIMYGKAADLDGIVVEM